MSRKSMELPKSASGFLVPAWRGTRAILTRAANGSRVIMTRAKATGVTMTRAPTMGCWLSKYQGKSLADVASSFYFFSSLFCSFYLLLCSRRSRFRRGSKSSPCCPRDCFVKRSTSPPDTDFETLGQTIRCDRPFAGCMQRGVGCNSVQRDSRWILVTVEILEKEIQEETIRC
jgi:hypothetical protein